jgi:hypothetical protein
MTSRSRSTERTTPPSQAGGLAMSTYNRKSLPGPWNVASQPRSWRDSAGTSPTWSFGMVTSAPGRENRVPRGNPIQSP